MSSSLCAYFNLSFLWLSLPLIWHVLLKTYSPLNHVLFLIFIKSIKRTVDRCLSFIKVYSLLGSCGLQCMEIWKQKTALLWDLIQLRQPEPQNIPWCHIILSVSYWKCQCRWNECAGKQWVCDCPFLFSLCLSVCVSAVLVVVVWIRLLILLKKMLDFYRIIPYFLKCLFRQSGVCKHLICCIIL